MKIFFLFLFSLPAFSSECSIELFSKVYRLESNQILQSRDLIKNSDCEDKVNNKLSNLIGNSQGTVGSDFLLRELQKDFPELLINIKNKKLSLLDLNLSLKEQLLSNNNLYFVQSRSLGNFSSIGLSEGEYLRSVCDACVSLGEKNVKIDLINTVDSTSRTIWLSSKIMAKIKVIRANRNISFQEKQLDPKDFYTDEIMTMTPDQSLTSLQNIHFYKTNKTIFQNAVITNLDLQPVNLVNYGTPANVILKSHNISLQKTALPTRSGRFGDIIELKGPNNKNIIGKVVDYNKVVIEL